jgi:hypothetical protein
VFEEVRESRSCRSLTTAVTTQPAPVHKPRQLLASPEQSVAIGISRFSNCLSSVRGREQSDPCARPTAEMAAPGWRAGAAKTDITPSFPVYMSGYGNRTQKHTSVLAPIYARALALEDAAGARAVQISVAR